MEEGECAKQNTYATFRRWLESNAEGLINRDEIVKEIDEHIIQTHQEHYLDQFEE